MRGSKITQNCTVSNVYENNSIADILERYFQWNVNNLKQTSYEEDMMI